MHGLGPLQKILFKELIRDYFDGDGNGMDWRDIERKVYEENQGDHETSPGAIAKLPEALAEKIKKNEMAYRYGRRIWIEGKSRRPAPQRYRIYVGSNQAVSTPRLPGISNDTAPYFPEMHWGKTGEKLKPLGISVVGTTKYSLELCISPRGVWRPPKGLTEPEYNSFADGAWRDAQPKGKPPYHNSNLWSVAGFAAHPSLFSGMDALSIDVHRVTHRDYAATNQSLHIVVPPTGKTMRSILRKDWVPSQACPFLPAANPLGVEYIPVTREPYQAIVFLNHESGTPVLDTIHGWVEAVLDGHRTAQHMPYPNETVFRKAYELAGMPIKPSMVRWMGFGVIGDSGLATLLGESQVPYSTQTVRQLFESRPNRRKDLEVKPLDLTFDAISNALETYQTRPAVAAALVLLLSRRRPSEVTVVHQK